MKKRICCLILPVVTVILELLPFGAVCNFMNPEGAPWRETFSYFSLTPFGYANFAPFLTAVVTCIVLALLIVYCVIGKQGIARKAGNILAVAVILSLGPLVFGISYYSLVGGLITATLAVEWFVLYRSFRA